MSLEVYKKWKEQQDKAAAKKAEQDKLRQRTRNQGIAEQYGARYNPGDTITFGTGVTYNPQTGGYSFGSGQFGYDPTKNISRIGNVGISGELDPNAVLQMGQQDYDAAEALIQSYMDRYNEMYSQFVESQSPEGFAVGSDGAYFTNNSEFEEWAKKTDPELYKNLQPHLSGREDDPESNQAFIKTAYDNAVKRLGLESSGPYSQMLKGQWEEMQTGYQPTTEVTPEQLNEYKQRMAQRYGSEYLAPGNGQPSAQQPTTPQKPATPQEPQQPSTPAQPEETGFDWKSLYDELSKSFTSLAQQPPKQKREQIGSFQAYTPQTFRQTYQSSTPYSGKGA